MRSVTPRPRRPTCARLAFEKKCSHQHIPTLRNRGCKLRGLAPFVGQSPQSAAAGSAGAQTAARINSGLDCTLSFRLARAKWPRNLIGRIFRAHVAELADAYGSGPYGATRGGSSPLVSNFLDDLLSLHGIFESFNWKV